eukprot:746756-Hanusia_phi.AAC.4
MSQQQTAGTAAMAAHPKEVKNDKTSATDELNATGANTESDFELMTEVSEEQKKPDLLNGQRLPFPLCPLLWSLTSRRSI